MSASSLVDPHGGVLVDRLVPAADAAAFTAHAATLPSFVLDARELADLELIATGAASPLDRVPGFQRLPVRPRPSPSCKRHRVAAAVHAGRLGRHVRSSPATSVRSAMTTVGSGASSRSPTCSPAIRSRSRARSTAPTIRRIPASRTCLHDHERWSAAAFVCCRSGMTDPSSNTGCRHASCARASPSSGGRRSPDSRRAIRSTVRTNT